MIELVITAIVCLILGSAYPALVTYPLKYIIYFGGYPYWKYTQWKNKRTIQQKMDIVLKNPKKYLRLHNRGARKDISGKRDIIDMDELIRRAKASKYFDKPYCMLTSDQKVKVVPK